MLSKEHILEIITKHKLQIKELGVEKIGVFGSYSRNEQTEKSDIDILISFQSSSETFDNLMDLSFLLQSLFPQHRIDIATTNGLSPYIGPKILQEVTYAKVAA